jgi:hypothetical protein
MWVVLQTEHEGAGSTGGRPRSLCTVAVLLAAIGLSGCTAAVRGHSAPDDPLRVTLSHFVRLDREAASRGAEAVYLDPRPLEARWSEEPDPRLQPPWPMQPADDAAERDPGRVAEITRGVAMSGASRDVIVCPGEFGSASCHMNGALMLIQASEPVVRDGAAKVFVRRLRLRPSTYQSLGESFFVVTLRRSEHGWSVTSSEYFGGS